MAQGRLLFFGDIEYEIKNASLIFITVDTPDGSADFSQVVDVAHSIETYINQDKQVIVKSTVPVGTCAQIAALIRAI
jgi:UDPglucose 6-dehydrogenase